MLENFDGIHDNYKVNVQIHVVIFGSCFYITCLRGIGHFLKNFSSDLRKSDQIVRNYVSKLYRSLFPHYRFQPLTTNAPQYYRISSISIPPPSV